MKLTEKQLEVLRELAHIRTSHAITRRRDGFATPMEFGGTNGSHHSGTATALARKGLVERKELKIPGDARGSCAYRITDAGLAAIGKEVVP